MLFWQSVRKGKFTVAEMGGAVVVVWVVPPCLGWCMTEENNPRRAMAEVNRRRRIDQIVSVGAAVDQIVPVGAAVGAEMGVEAEMRAGRRNVKGGVVVVVAEVRILGEEGWKSLKVVVLHAKVVVVEVVKGRNDERLTEGEGVVE